jgi:polysaccharide biosynthesis transport protein
LADQTIYVIRWARTRREVADEGIRQLRESGVPLAGAVLSAVNVREHAQYGYGDSGYYYGESSRYYGR